jgi:hypothetical protein
MRARQARAIDSPSGLVSVAMRLDANLAIRRPGQTGALRSPVHRHRTRGVLQVRPRRRRCPKASREENAHVGDTQGNVEIHQIQLARQGTRKRFMRSIAKIGLSQMPTACASAAFRRAVTGFPWAFIWNTIAARALLQAGKRRHLPKEKRMSDHRVMRVAIVAERCQGHNRCCLVAPALNRLSTTKILYFWLAP